MAVLLKVKGDTVSGLINPPVCLLVKTEHFSDIIYRNWKKLLFFFRKLDEYNLKTDSKMNKTIYCVNGVSLSHE